MSTIATSKNTISVFVGAPRLSHATSAPSAVSVVMKRRRAKGNAPLPVSATNGRSTPPRVGKDSVKQRGPVLTAAALPDDELNLYERGMAFQKSLRATDRGPIAPQASQEAAINAATDPKAIYLNSSAIHGLPPTTKQSSASSTFDAITVSIPISLKAIHRFHHNASLRLKVDDRVDGNYLSSSDSDEEKESNAIDNAAAGTHSGGVFGGKPSCMNTSSQLPSHNISVAMQSFEEERDQEEEDCPPVIRNIFGVAGRRQSGDVMKSDEDDSSVYTQIEELALGCRPKPLKGSTQQQDFISFKQSDGHNNDDEGIHRLLHIEPSGEGHQRKRSYPKAYGDQSNVPSNEDAKSISSSIITLLNNQRQDGEFLTVLSGAAGTGKSTRMFGPCRRRDGNTEEGAAALIDQVVSSVIKEYGDRHMLSAVVSAVESFPIPIHGPIPAGKDSTRNCDSIRIGYSDLGVRDGDNDNLISFDNAIDRQTMNVSADPGDSIQSLLLPFYTSTHVARSADNSSPTPIFEPFGSQSEFTKALYDLLSRSRMWSARSSDTKVGRAQSNSNVASTVAPISDSVETLPTVAHEGQGGESLLLFDQRMRAISGTSATLLPQRYIATDEYPVIEPVTGGFQDTETVIKGHLIVTIVFRLQSSSAAPNTPPGRGRELGPFSQIGLGQQITKSFTWCSPQPAFEPRQQPHRNRKKLTSVTQQSSNTTFIVGQSNSFIRVLTSSSPSSEILVTSPFRANAQQHPSSNKSLNQQINKKLLPNHLPPPRSNSAIMSESGHAALNADDDDKYSDEYEFESVSNYDDGNEAALNGPTSGTNFDVDTASESSQEDHAKSAMTSGEPSDRLVTTARPIVESEATTKDRPTKIADGDAYGHYDGEEEVEGASTIDAPVDNSTSIEGDALSPTSFLQESEAIMRLKSERDALTNALLAPVGSRPTPKAHDSLIDQYTIVPSYSRTHTIYADASPDRDSECGPSSIPDTNPPPTPPSANRGGTVIQRYEQREVGPAQVVEIARSREVQQSDVSVAAEVDSLPKSSWQDGLRAAMDRVRAAAAVPTVSKVSAVSARKVITAKNAPTPSSTVINQPRSNNTERYTKGTTVAARPTQYSNTKDSFLTAQPQPVERDVNSSTSQSVRDEDERSSHALLAENLRLRSLLAESKAELRGTLADQSTFIQSLGTSVVEPIIEFYDNQHAAEVADHRHQQRESAEVLKSLIIQNSLATELGQSTNNPSVPSYNNQTFVNNYYVTEDDQYPQPLLTSTVTESDRPITVAAAKFSKELAKRRAVRNAVVGNTSLNTATSVPTIDKVLRSQIKHANQSLLSMSALRHSSLSRPRSVAASTGVEVQVPSTLYPSRPSMRSSSAAAPVVSHFYDADGNLITPTDTFRKVLNHTGSAYEKQTLRLQRLTGQFDKLKIDHAHISIDRDRMAWDLASNEATIQALRKQVAELSDKNAVLEGQLLHDGAADTVKDIFAQGSNGGNLFTVSMSADQDAMVAEKGDDSSGRVADQQDALLAAIATFAEDVYSVTGAVEEALSRAGHSDAALIGPTVTRLTGGLRRRMQQDHLQSIIPAAREAHLALVRAKARERQCLNLIVSSNLPSYTSKQHSPAASQPRGQLSRAGPSNSIKR